MHRFIYHITTKSQVDSLEESGFYIPKAYSIDGFIHCSTRCQIPDVLQRFYRDEQDLVLLKIDATRVESLIVEENLEGGSELFPHIYGKLSSDAIIDMYDLTYSNHGHFVFPGELRNDGV